MIEYYPRGQIGFSEHRRGQTSRERGSDAVGSIPEEPLTRALQCDHTERHVVPDTVPPLNHLGRLPYLPTIKCPKKAKNLPRNFRN